MANNSPTAGDFVGCDNGTTIPLEIRHDAGDQQIECYSTGDAVPEMFLSPTITGFSFNGYTTLDLSGFLGVGNDFSMTTPPLSKLHLSLDGSSPTLGYRDWMKSGLLNTEGLDGLYIGLKNEGDPELNSAVLNWSDSRLAPPDPLRFIFTNGFAGSGAAATSEGLEMVRVLPDGSGDEGFFGIGDFYTAGVDPDERLDVLNGDVRIRDLPDNSNERDNFNRFVVVNSSTGELRWRNINTVPGAPDCDWDIDDPNNDLSTAWDPSPGSGCPGEDWNVGIGQNSGLTGKPRTSSAIA